MKVYDRIVSIPDVMQGKPCIKGTRITVANLLRQAGHGRSVQELCSDYPQLQPEDIKQAFLFSSELAAADAYELVP